MLILNAWLVPEGGMARVPHLGRINSTRCPTQVSACVLVAWIVARSLLVEGPGLACDLGILYEG